MTMEALGVRLKRRDKAVRGDAERGANLVEFAILAPFLILLLLGIVEFGYLFAEYNDVRHGAREGARLAAVDAGNNSFLHTATCDSMDLTASVTVQFEDGASGAIGDTGRLTVTGTPTPLSGLGLITVFLPSQLQSQVEFRLEQPSDSWSTDGSAFTCP